MRFCHLVLGGAVTAAMVAGCTRKPPVAPARPPVSAPVKRPVLPAPVAPALYVATAASIDLFAIRSAELALRRSAMARHRQFATMMIAAHRGTSAQLSFAGRRLNLLPSAALLPKHWAMLVELEASANFDRTYRRLQIAVHEEAIGLHEAFARRGSSATLRPVAAAAAPTVRQHLAALRSMR